MRCKPSLVSPAATSARRAQRRGMVLVVVLVVITLLTLAGYTYTEMMRAEHQAAIAHGTALQARALADSGLEAVEAFLQQDPQLQFDTGGAYDNPLKFRGRMVTGADDPDALGRFTVVAPQLGNDGLYAGIRFGLEDESARLNLNTLLLAEQQQEGAGRGLLLALPNMTEDIADAILDWLDPDDEPREFGAELNDYINREPPYAPRNGPLESLEELLLVQGVTPWLLFGADTNRNGVIDSYELGGEQAAGFDNSDGSMNRGWSAYLTLYSLEPNVNPDGEPRIWLNNEDLEQLHDDLVAQLGQEWATYIVAYRQNGPYTGRAQSTPVGGRKPDLERPAQVPLQTALDLIGTRVQTTLAGEENRVIIESPLPIATVDLSPLLDYVSVNPSPVIPGRININQAPRAILQGIPGMTEELVESILTNREPDPALQAENRRHETWLLSDGLVSLEEMKALMPFVTGAGGVYRAQIVGYFESGGPAARIEAVIDATNPAPRRLFWRDISHLGRGFPLETLGLGQ